MFGIGKKKETEKQVERNDGKPFEEEVALRIKEGLIEFSEKVKSEEFFCLVVAGDRKGNDGDALLSANMQLSAMTAMLVSSADKAPSFRKAMELAVEYMKSDAYAAYKDIKE